MLCCGCTPDCVPYSILVVVENGASALYVQDTINSVYLSQYSIMVSTQFCKVLRFCKLVSQEV